jgi:elongation factor Ts
MDNKVDAKSVKSLRDKTGAPFGDCRQALEESAGDETKALARLKERGMQMAQKREGRATGQGRIEAYVHHDGRIAALVEVACETDFVARTPEFAQFCRDVAMQVAAMSPRFVREDENAGSLGIPAEDKAEAVLLLQPFIKDAKSTVGDLLKALIAKTGENVVIRRFARFGLGESG